MKGYLELFITGVGIILGILIYETFRGGEWK